MRKKILLCSALIGILVIFGFAIAQENNTSELPAFSRGEDGAVIGPPPPPGETALPLLTLELQDISTNDLLEEVHADLTIVNLDTGEKTRTLRYIENGIFEEGLEAGTYNITIRLDKIETPGKDYFSEVRVEVTGDTNKTALMNPTGSVMGIVYLSEKVVPNARVKFECSSAYGDVGETVTDDFGSFKGDWLPIGSCKVSALHGKVVGSEEVEVKAGELGDVRINLISELVGGYALLFIAIILLIVVIGGAYFYYTKKEEVEEIVEKEEKVEKVEEGKIRITKKMNDLMETLSDSEREVVRFLIDNNGKSTQAKIYHGTGIPKASLSRYVGNLENKKIVRTKMLGKVKRVELTEWFLSD